MFVYCRYKLSVGYTVGVNISVGYTVGVNIRVGTKRSLDLL